MAQSFEAQEHSFVLGHRGARHARPENTLSALEQARREGALGSEFDVRLSADRVPYVIHDADLTRVTDGRDTRFVGDLLSTELDRVRLSGDEPVPRLAAVLDWAGENDQLLNIELKTELAKEDPIAHVVADLLCTYEFAARACVVSCFHPWLLARFHRALPTVERAFLLSRGHRSWSSPSLLRRLRCRSVHPEAALLLREPELLSELHCYRVNTWTVNSAEDAVTLANMGVRAIITDYPKRIVDALATIPPSGRRRLATPDSEPPSIGPPSSERGRSASAEGAMSNGPGRS